MDEDLVLTCLNFGLLRMGQSRKWIVALACSGPVVGAALLLIPAFYESYATARLTNTLDHQHGQMGWVVYWTAADAQDDQRLHFLRTLYVRFAYPALQDYTRWKRLTFTYQTSTPNRPWHYVVCVLSREREVTYFWSICENRWVVAWDNRIRDFPEDVQRDYATRLRSVERRNELNRSTNRPAALLSKVPTPDA